MVDLHSNYGRERRKSTDGERESAYCTQDWSLSSKRYPLTAAPHTTQALSQLNNSTPAPCAPLGGAAAGYWGGERAHSVLGLREERGGGRAARRSRRRRGARPSLSSRVSQLLNFWSAALGAACRVPARKKKKKGKKKIGSDLRHRRGISELTFNWLTFDPNQQILVICRSGSSPIY